MEQVKKDIRPFIFKNNRIGELRINMILFLHEYLGHCGRGEAGYERMQGDTVVVHLRKVAEMYGMKLGLETKVVTGGLSLWQHAEPRFHEDKRETWSEDMEARKKPQTTFVMMIASFMADIDGKEAYGSLGIHPMLCGTEEEWRRLDGKLWSDAVVRFGRRKYYPRFLMYNLDDMEYFALREDYPYLKTDSDGDLLVSALVAGDPHTVYTWGDWFGPRWVEVSGTGGTERLSGGWMDIDRILYKEAEKEYRWRNSNPVVLAAQLREDIIQSGLEDQVLGYGTGYDPDFDEYCDL